MGSVYVFNVTPNDTTLTINGGAVSLYAWDNLYNPFSTPVPRTAHPDGTTPSFGPQNKLIVAPEAAPSERYDVQIISQTLDPDLVLYVFTHNLAFLDHKGFVLSQSTDPQVVISGPYKHHRKGEHK